MWSGHKAHLTETCDDSTPNLIANVETTTAAVSDDAATSTLHAALDARGLLPTTHIADTGFVNSALFIDARERYGVDLIGSTRSDPQWQAQADAGFAARDFAVDFAQQRVTCPAGKANQSWTPALARGTTPVIKIKFAVATAGLARSGRSARARSRHAGRSRSAPKPNTRRSASGGHGSKRRASQPSTRGGPASRARLRRRALVPASADALFRARQDAPRPPDDGDSDEPRRFGYATRAATQQPSRRSRNACRLMQENRRWLSNQHFHPSFPVPGDDVPPAEVPTPTDPVPTMPEPPTV